MGSPCCVHIYVDDEQAFWRVIKACKYELEKLEATYSRYRVSSLVSQINQSAGKRRYFPVDPQFASLLNYAEMAFSVSDGLFDITAGVLNKIWNFKQQRIPSQLQIDKILPKVGWRKVDYNEQHIRLSETDMEIDLGGIVKEYAADVVATLMKQLGIRHGLVDLGGDIAVIGPHPDNSPWKVAIKHPADPSRAVATIELSSGGLASSGDYARCIELNGERFSHILNPKTGWPIKGLSAVSVWAPQCVVAGTLATTAMLKGNELGLSWLQKVGCHFLTVDNQMKVTSNLSFE
jgi:thiamine biosynthesis lipoprotein